MLKTKSKTVARTLTFPMDLYDKFKEAVPERHVSAMLAELMRGYLSKRAFRHLAKMKFRSEKEAGRFERIIRESNEADLKSIH